MCTLQMKMTLLCSQNCYNIFVTAYAYTEKRSDLIVKVLIYVTESEFILCTIRITQYERLSWDFFDLVT